VSTAPVITIFVRHAEDCKWAGDEFSRRCDCRKHLRWTQNGTQQRMKAGTRSWEEAEDVKRNLQDQLAGRETVKPVEAKSLLDAADLFQQSKKLEGITADGLARYARELTRLTRYCAAVGIYTVQGVTGEMLTAYAGTWTVSSGTKVLALKTLKAFFRHCYESKWLDRMPKFPRINSDSVETEPLTAEEYARLLSVVTAPKLRALVQLMRWSGLAVRDAATLRRSEIQHDVVKDLYRVVTNRQKTGTPVSVPVPARVATELLAVESENPKFLFWHGNGDGQNFAIGYGSKISEAFDKAGITSECFMKSHRLRDTFAVDLLSKGVPLEEVSKLLGHTSIRTTEKHYAKWVKGRQDRLDSLVAGTWGD
jgi:integrase/recombinase XerD